MFVLKYVKWIIFGLVLFSLIYSNYSIYKNNEDTLKAITSEDKNKIKISETWLGIKSPTVITLGSSVTEGNGASSIDLSWAGLLNSYFLETNPDTTFINLGVGGYTTLDVRQNTLRIATNMEPDVIIFEDCLINDFKRGVTTSQSEENIEYIYNSLINKFPNIRVIIMPPNNMTLEKTRNSEGLTYEEYVIKVGEFIQSRGWEYIDFWNTYNKKLEQKGLSFNQSISADQTHPNNLGYSTWFNAIKNYFTKMQ